MNSSESGYDITPLSAEAIERLARDLNEEEYRILLDHGTEQIGRASCRERV